MFTLNRNWAINLKCTLKWELYMRLKPRSCSILGSTPAALQSIWHNIREASNCAATYLVAMAWTCNGVHEPRVCIVDVWVPFFRRYMESSRKLTETMCSCFEAVQLSVSLNGKPESNLMFRLPIKSPSGTATNLFTSLFIVYCEKSISETLRHFIIYIQFS